MGLARAGQETQGGGTHRDAVVGRVVREGGSRGSGRRLPRVRPKAPRQGCSLKAAGLAEVGEQGRRRLRTRTFWAVGGPVECGVECGAALA